MIKPIQTFYKGYHFRSRLEARWAVFFDALEIKWEYEYQGYRLSDGTKYLPDFYLPTFSGGMFCEVKPDNGDFSKARQLCLDLGRPVWLCVGVPDFKVYQVLERWECVVDYQLPFLRGIWRRIEFEVYEIPGIPNNDQAWGEDRMFWQPGYENSDGSVDKEYFYDHYIKAVYAARSARFEYGERPNV